MLTAQNVEKRFGNRMALMDFSAGVEKGSIYGLVGSNGSGKSTLLRLFCGVYAPERGSVTLDDMPVFENPAVKGRIFFVSDDFYFLPHSSIDQNAAFFAQIYPTWSPERYKRMQAVFPLDVKARINGFSKGMRRQAALMLALSATPEYLLLDEAFDGLDPIVRVALRKLLADDLADRGASVIIASHNLRELEDMCDHVGVLHQGRLLLEREIDELRLGFCKVQAVFPPESDLSVLDTLPILRREQTGSVHRLLIKASKEEALTQVSTLSPIFFEAVPLTLEEVFINEMEAVGYDYNNVVF